MEFAQRKDRGHMTPRSIRSQPGISIFLVVYFRFATKKKEKNYHGHINISIYLFIFYYKK